MPRGGKGGSPAPTKPRAGEGAWSRRNTSPVILLNVLGKSADDLLNRLIRFHFKEHLGKATEIKLDFRNDDRLLLEDPRTLPNQKWEIRFGFLDDISPVITGYIRDVEPSYADRRTVSLTLYDGTLTLSKTSRGKNWGKVPTSDIAKAIAKAHGLKAAVEPSNDTPKQAWVQPNDVNDIRYLRDLAVQIDFEVFMDGTPETLVYRKKAYDRVPKAVITYFDDGSERAFLKSFKPKVKSLGPLSTSASGTDAKKGKGDKGAETGKSVRMAAVANYNQSGVADQVIAASSKQDVSKPVPANTDTKKLAEVHRNQMLDRSNEASSSHALTPSLRRGDIYELRGLDKQLNGKWYIVGVTHEMSGSSHSTSVEWKRDSTNGKGKKNGNVNNKDAANGGPKPGVVQAVYGGTGVVDNNVIPAGAPVPPVPKGPVRQ